MANTVFQSNNPLTQKIWGKAIAREALKQSQFARLVGYGPMSVIRVWDDLQGNKGDTVYTPLVMALTGAGVGGDNTLLGNEEAMVSYRDTLVIDQLRHAVKSDGKMTDQRTFINIMEEAKPLLSMWAADRIDTWAANQAVGNTGEANLLFTGNNATVAPSSTAGNTRIFYGDGTCTTENSLSTSACFFTLPMLDRLALYTDLATPKIQKADTPWGRKFVFVAHTNVIHRMRTDATAGQVTWYNLNQAFIQGGEGRGSSLITSPGDEGFQGIYNDVAIVADSRMPLAPGTTGVRRCAFLGANAMTMAFGRGYGLQQWLTVPDDTDYKNQTSVSIGLIGGLKKTVYNSIDFGAMTLSVHAPNFA